MGLPIPQNYQGEVAIWVKEPDGSFSLLSCDVDGKLLVAGDLVLTEDTVTPTIISVGASESGTIPSGAKGWTITFLTGSGTLGGVAVSAGFSDSDSKTTAAAISYTTNSASSAYVRYNS